MAALADNVGILFRIKADSSDAEKDFKKFKKELKDIEDAGKDPLARLAQGAGLSAQQFDNLKVGAMAAATGVTAVAAAAAVAVTAFVAAGVGLFKMAQSASEVGSELKDMQDKTGLAAVTLSTLKLNADSAGSSLEQVGGGVEKFAKLLGQAADGSEKAQKTLKDLGVDTTNLDAGLRQVIKTIAAANEGTEQITLAQKAFGKSGADLIPVIKQMSGDLEKAEKEAKKLGLTLTDADIKAADEFGDTLTTLTGQLKSLASQFALQYAPIITNAMNSIIASLARNQDAIRAAGTNFANVLRGMQSVASSSTVSMIGSFASWAARIISYIDPVQNAIFLTIRALNLLGLSTPKGVGTAQEGGGFVASASSIPSISPGGGGGGRGGGGASAKDTAEDNRRKEVQAAQDAMRDRLAIYKSIADEAVAIFDEQLSRNTISEFQHLKEIRSLKEREAKYEAAQLAQFARDANLNADERAEAELKRDIAKREVRIEELKTQTLINKEYNKANKELFEKIEQQEEFVRLAKEELELARKTSAENAAERRLKNYQYDQELKQKLDREKSETGFGAGFENGLGTSSITTNVTDPITGVTSAVTDASNAFTVFGQIAGQAVNAVAQGIGSMVQAWVLYGSAGPNAMKKMVASVLAGVAAQSAVLAVFELAKGFAALFFNPAEAAAHFHAAALFGSIAVATGLAGRAVAGDSFNQQTAGGGNGGGSGGEAAGQPERLNFTERFNGFLQPITDQMARVMQRTNEVLGGVTEAVDTFNQKFGVTTPGAVVMAGAGDAGEAIFGAVTGHLDSDLRAGSNFIRSQGKME